MGLDMYAYTIKEEIIGDAQVDIDIRQALDEYLPKHPELNADHIENADSVEIAFLNDLFDPDFAYWRKFNALHGWMQTLYVSKQGKDPDFNCSTLRLMPEDIDRLDAEKSSLTPTEGFFFGSTDPIDQEDIDEVTAFVNRARKAFKGGFAVIYDSWW